MEQRRTKRPMNRRAFIALAGAASLCPGVLVGTIGAQPAIAKGSLLAAPLELGGDWGQSRTEAVTRVLLRVRETCLSGLSLPSDRQPARLRVDNHTNGPPAIWLHDDPPDRAWIIVNIGPFDWCKLAYQFGHELGHVLCNSWQRSAKPRPPSQWLEEALVEAFSIRGLGLLATSWEKDPPFSGNAGFAASIRQYRADLMQKYMAGMDQRSPENVRQWFRERRPGLENGSNMPAGQMVLAVLDLYESERAAGDGSCVEDLGALNRWPERSGLPIDKYLDMWAASCAQIGAPGRAPKRIRAFLQVD